MIAGARRLRRTTRFAGCVLAAVSIGARDVDRVGDIDVYDSNYGDTGWDGQTKCSDKVATTWLWQRHCDVFTIKFNTYVTARYSSYKSQVIGCHEFGHTAGLDHRSSSNDDDQVSCMRGSGYASTVLDNHDIDVINDHF